MTHPIPNAALDDRLGFVGTAGSGKTYGAGTAVERLLARKDRVVVLDPLGVWWGLRLTFDGVHASPYDVVIFGGAHGDLPLTENAGALIGETVAGMKESAIIDLSQLGTKAAERRFTLAFLTALYRKVDGNPLHVVFDEADMWAPQVIRDRDQEPQKLLGMMETIVRRGRIKGFVPWLITQRPAVVNKDVLSQVDGLVAFKLTASQDRKALGDWIEGQADREEGKRILAQLPTKQTGEAVVWLPARGVLTTAMFPPKATFDSSRTPKHGEKKTAAELKPIDLGALKERLASVEAETKANDPKALKAEIARLKADLSKATTNSPKNIPPDPKAIEEAERRGYALGADATRISLAEKATAAATLIHAASEKFASAVMDALATLKAQPAAYIARPAALRVATPPPKPRATPQPHEPVAVEGITNPQRRVLASLAFWQSVGHDAPTREQVAGVAGYSPGSGGFNNLLGGLRTACMITYPTPGTVHMNGAAPPIDPPSAEEARDMLLSVLSNPQKRIVEAMVGGKAMTREEIAERTEYSAGSGGFNNLLGSLRTLKVIDYPQTGMAALTDWARQLLA